LTESVTCPVKVVITQHRVGYVNQIIAPRTLPTASLRTCC